MEKHLKVSRESTLRNLYSSKKGLIVHCSALSDDGTVFAVAGIADTGKSTLAKRLNGIMTSVNDDMNIFEFSGHKKIKVSTYFTQAENQGYHYLINENVTGFLKAVLFPVKEYEKESCIEHVKDKGYIWKKLLTCIAPPIKDEDHLFPNYLEMIDKLTVTVDFFHIYHNLKDPAENIVKLLRSIK